jgi:F0F1-type ATP synthase epsilon subunit
LFFFHKQFQFCRIGIIQNHCPVINQLTDHVIILRLSGLSAYNYGLHAH